MKLIYREIDDMDAARKLERQVVEDARNNGVRVGDTYSYCGHHHRVVAVAEGYAMVRIANTVPFVVSTKSVAIRLKARKSS